MYVCMYVLYVYIFMYCIETVCIEEALSIQEESHPGEVSMETAVTLNNLGVVNAHIGNNMYVCMYVCMYTKRWDFISSPFSLSFFAGDLKKAQSYLQRTADVSLCVFVSAA